MFLSLVGYGDPGVMGTVDIGLWGSVGSPVHSPQHHTIATINNANIGYILFSDLCGLVPISAHLVPVYKSHMNVLRYDTNLLGCCTSGKSLFNCTYSMIPIYLAVIPQLVAVLQ